MQRVAVGIRSATLFYCFKFPRRLFLRPLLSGGNGAFERIG